MSSERWDLNEIPDQDGRLAIITGANSGIGKETARALAKKNAKVIIAVRNTEKGQRAVEDICRENPHTDVSIRILDLASLASVERFANSIIADHERLDLLINNAGVMMCPYGKTEDGFEMQMGTNHLGHFVLTGRLLPLLKRTAASRVVVLASLAHKFAKLDLSDLNWESRKYNTTQAYADSKLANLHFVNFLSEKLRNEGASPVVVAAHPGVTSTDLGRHARHMDVINWFMAQKAKMGALPALRAATDAKASSGDYFGPGKFWEVRGHPVKVEPSSRAKDLAEARQLWHLSEAMTGFKY